MTFDSVLDGSSSTDAMEAFVTVFTLCAISASFLPLDFYMTKRQMGDLPIDNGGSNNSM